MLLRDRLAARLAEMGTAPDYPRLAAEVLGIRNAPAPLAERLVAQAMVIEDRRDAWRVVGERVCASAPEAPGVYVLKDASGRPLYVGKANNIRRRLRAHFAPRRWRGLKAAFARASEAAWQVVGSELEALLREATLIDELQPVVNVQVGPPALEHRSVPARLLRNVIVVAPSAEPDGVELIAARPDGAWLIQRAARSGAGLQVHTRRLLQFFRSVVPRRGARGALAGDRGSLAPLVYSWLAGRGEHASRIDPDDVASPQELRSQLMVLFRDEQLFAERIVVLHSKIRSGPRRRIRESAALGPDDPTSTRP